MNKNNKIIYFLYFIVLIPTIYLLDKGLYYENKKENVVKTLIKLLIEIFLIILFSIIITKLISNYFKIKHIMINPFLLLSNVLVLIILYKNKTYSKFIYLINTSIEPFIDLNIKSIKLKYKNAKKPKRRKIFNKHHYNYNNSNRVKKIYDREKYNLDIKNNDIISGEYKYADLPIQDFYKKTQKSYDFIEG